VGDDAWRPSEVDDVERAGNVAPVSASGNARTDPRGVLKPGRAKVDTSGEVAPSAGRTTAGIADKEGP